MKGEVDQNFSRWLIKLQGNPQDSMLKLHELIFFTSGKLVKLDMGEKKSVYTEAQFKNFTASLLNLVLFLLK